MKKYNTTVPAISRRKNVIDRLETQLKEGRKYSKEVGVDKTDTVPLTKDDVSRINRELETLKERV